MEVRAKLQKPNRIKKIISLSPVEAVINVLEYILEIADNNHHQVSEVAENGETILGFGLF